MKKQNVHVSRYADSKVWAMAIEPDDKSWIVFVDADGKPHLYLVVDIEDDGLNFATEAEAVAHADDEPKPTGRIIRGYVPAGSIEAQAMGVLS